MSYTKIAKPSNTDYTVIRPEGKDIYDSVSLEYDDSSGFYDGVDPNLYTDLSKPTNDEAILLAGMTVGLLMPLTNPVRKTIGFDNWTDVNKPTT